MSIARIVPVLVAGLLVASLSLSGCRREEQAPRQTGGGAGGQAQPSDADKQAQPSDTGRTGRYDAEPGGQVGQQQGQPMQTTQPSGTGDQPGAAQPRSEQLGTDQSAQQKAADEETAQPVQPVPRPAAPAAPEQGNQSGGD